MSAKSTRQIQCHAWLRERWSYKPLVSRDEERIRFCQRRQALLVLDIPTGSLIFNAIFAAHADPFLMEEAPPLHLFVVETRQAASLLHFRIFGFGFVEEREVGVGIFPGGE